MHQTFILALAFLTYSINIKAQEAKSHVKNTSTINKYNKQKKKDGLWYEKVDALRGEKGYQTFGKYNNGEKIGIWKTIDLEGKPISTETYQNNVLNGPAQYYENGQLIIEGNWRGLNPKYPLDTITVVNIRTGIDTIVVVPSEYGALEHGIWKYYTATTGSIYKEVEYQIGTIINTKVYGGPPITDSSIIKNIDTQLPHNKKKNYKPPTKRRSQIQY